MATGSHNLTTWAAKRIIGDNSTAEPEGALLHNGSGRGNTATGDTWIFYDDTSTSGTPWGFKHDQPNDRISFFGSGTNTSWLALGTGNFYVYGKVGIGYDPSTSGNTYKLYVNGTSYFANTITSIGNIYVSNTTPHIYLQNTNWTKGTTPEANYYSALEFHTSGDYNTNKRVGLLEVNIDTSNNVWMNIWTVPNVTDSTSWSGIRLKRASDGVLTIYNAGNTEVTGSIVIKNGSLNIDNTTTDLTAANNGSSSTIYHSIWGRDKDMRSWFCVEGYTNADGSVAAFLGVRNYNTSGTAQSWKGITIKEAKDNTLTYTVSDPAKFITAIMGDSDSTKFYRGDKTWSNALTGDISIGSRGVTSGPSSITYSNRITIVPYFHTGGPWYIKSGDDSSNAHLALFYNTSNLIQIRHNAYTTIGDSVCVTGSAWGAGTTMIGKNGTDKIIIGYLASSTTGAVVGAHASTLQAWAPLNISGSSVQVRGSETLWAKWLDGCLSLFPTTSSYREGMRIHSAGSWSDITLCGNDNTGDSGTSANSWFIGNNNGNFYITRNGSTGGDARLECVNNQWRFRTPSAIQFLNIAGNAQNIMVNAIGCGGDYSQFDLANYRFHCIGNGRIVGHFIFNTTTAGNNAYADGSAIQIREVSTVTTGQSAWTYAPKIGFHWGGRYQGVLGLHSNGQFYFGLSGGTSNVTVNTGTLQANGYLKSTANSNTVTIGSQNTSWCHFDNSANIPFYFGKNVHVNSQLVIYNTGTKLYNNYLEFAQGGGWFMSDSTWIRSRGNKSVYINTGELRCDGATWGGMVKMTSNWIGFYSANGSGTRYGYIQCNVNRMYFRKENGVSTYHFDMDGGYLYTSRCYNAVWNDYAECRNTATEEPGRCVTESTMGQMQLTTKRLEPGCKIISDTYGTCIGATDEIKTPIAVSGRVLAFPYRNRDEYPLGAAVCSAPNGTVDIMTRDEIMLYPERIVGTVSEIPNYEIWHCGSKELKEEIQVNGRIWIYVR